MQERQCVKSDTLPSNRNCIWKEEKEEPVAYCNYRTNTTLLDGANLIQFIHY